MEDGSSRIEFWKRFFVNKCLYPSPDLLRKQLAHAEFTVDCECGCNSYRIWVDPAFVLPLLPPEPEPKSKGSAAVFMADFKLIDGNTLSVTLFADAQGHLVGVDVDCCANSFPVPDRVIVEEPPFHTWASGSLFREV